MHKVIAKHDDRTGPIKHIVGRLCSTGYPPLCSYSSNWRFRIRTYNNRILLVIAPFVNNNNNNNNNNNSTYSKTEIQDL